MAVHDGLKYAHGRLFRSIGVVQCPDDIADLVEEPNRPQRRRSAFRAVWTPRCDGATIRGRGLGRISLIHVNIFRLPMQLVAHPLTHPLMNRRRFASFLAGDLVLARSVAAQAAKLHRIGYLGGRRRAQNRTSLRDFSKGCGNWDMSKERTFCLRDDITETTSSDSLHSQLNWFNSK